MQPVRLPFGDLKERVVIDFEKCQLDLHESHLEYTVIAEYEEEDDKMGIKTIIKVDEQSVYNAKSIGGICRYFDSDERQWALTMNIEDRNFTWYFDQNKDWAEGVFLKLKSYKIESSRILND